MDCGDWTVGNSASDGTYGTANDLASWTDPTQVTCDFGAARLYCLSDAPMPLFIDGFESGDTSAWSSTVP